MTWLGKTFKLRDGDEVVVTEIKMCANQKIDLTLVGRNGLLFLTTDEILLNAV